MIKQLLQIKYLGNILSWIIDHRKLSVLIVVILAVIFYFVLPKGQKPVLTETASTKDIVKTVSVTGDIASDNSINLSFQTGGKLVYLGAKEGDEVKQGQAIASLDRSQLEANFRQAQQDFIAAKAASDQYYDGHKNATESYDEKVKRTALDAAQNKAYDQMMKVQEDLNNSTLYSPIDGIITRADAKTAGVNVTAATVFTVTDPSSLNFKMEVDEADIGNVKIGQKVKVSLDSFPDDLLTLIVDKIDFVSHKTSSGGNAFYVEADLPQTDNYRVGMSGNADIIVASKNNVLSVSSSSVTDDDYIYVKKNKLFEKRKIKLGLQTDTEAEVISGLSQGEVVALDPSSVHQNLIKK